MSSLDLRQELRGTESTGRLTGRDHRLKDPGWIDAHGIEAARIVGRVRAAASAAAS